MFLFMHACVTVFRLYVYNIFREKKIKMQWDHNLSFHTISSLKCVEVFLCSLRGYTCKNRTHYLMKWASIAEFAFTNTRTPFSAMTSVLLSANGDVDLSG